MSIYDQASIDNMLPQGKDWNDLEDSEYQAILNRLNQAMVVAEQSARAKDTAAVTRENSGDNGNLAHYHRVEEPLYQRLIAQLLAIWTQPR